MSHRIAGARRQSKSRAKKRVAEEHPLRLYNRYGIYLSAGLLAAFFAAAIFKQEAWTRVLNSWIFANITFMTGLQLEHRWHTDREKAEDDEPDFYEDHEDF